MSSPTLAEDAVARERALDALAEELLRAALGQRHGGVVGLQLDRGVRLEMTQREGPGELRCLHGELEDPAELLCVHRRLLPQVSRGHQPSSTKRQGRAAGRRAPARTGAAGGFAVVEAADRGRLGVP